MGYVKGPYLSSKWILIPHSDEKVIGVQNIKYNGKLLRHFEGVGLDFALHV